MAARKPGTRPGDTDRGASLPDLKAEDADPKRDDPETEAGSSEEPPGSAETRWTTRIPGRAVPISRRVFPTSLREMRAWRFYPLIRIPI